MSKITSYIVCVDIHDWNLTKLIYKASCLICFSESGSWLSSSPVLVSLAQNQSIAISPATSGPLLTHWGRVTYICVSKLTIIGSDNGLSPGRRQAIIWTNAGILLIGPLGANFSEILIKILTFSLKKMQFKVSSAKWRPFCIGLNGLIESSYEKTYARSRDWGQG